mgnify:CR=1 FL=1
MIDTDCHAKMRNVTMQDDNGKKTQCHLDPALLVIDVLLD